ncbi:Hypothetical_protein [Hexamita inflata]|uniref:Hypothetical_protein n=1 Tax=Hexamita inflata TaxID=28002 RepID=A0AA86NH29_9EUKA|nr:Hypothetical protein HINF_LOCUS6638 [Hexamita inflata]
MNNRSEVGVQYQKIDGSLRYFRLNYGYQLNISQLAYHVWSYQIYSKEFKKLKIEFNEIFNRISRGVQNAVTKFKQHTYLFKLSCFPSFPNLLDIQRFRILCSL